MKAVVYEKYGPPEVLSLLEIQRPKPKAGEVLVRVKAVSLNLSDWECLIGEPLYSRIWGLRRPRMRTLGSDIAGTIEAVGEGVTHLAQGDDVFGDVMGSFGGFAEYVCAPAKTLMRKPAGISFVDASTVPQAGVIAMQGLRAAGELQAGKKVLINGAGGGSGMFAIQVAKLRGAIVTAVDNAEKLEHMRDLGAQHVIDYRREDFATSGESFDLILDLVGTRPASAVKQALEPGGTYAMVGGTMAALAQTLLVGPVAGALSGRRIKVLSVAPSFDDMLSVTELMESGALRATIDRVFPLEQTADALRYLGEGHIKGKAVVVPLTA